MRRVLSGRGRLYYSYYSHKRYDLSSMMRSSLTRIFFLVYEISFVKNLLRYWLDVYCLIVTTYTTRASGMSHLYYERRLKVVSRLTWLTFLAYQIARFC